MSKNSGIKTLEINHRDFAENAEEFIGRMESTPTKLTSVDRALGARGVCVAVTDARESDNDPTVIAQRAFQAFVEDPFEQQRDKVIAVKMNARVIGVDTPGVGLSRIKSRSRLAHKVGALKGDMDTIVDSQLFAVRQAAGINYEDPTRFLTYSMPNQTLPAIIRSPLAINIERIDAVEMVNDDRWSLRALLKAIGAEDKFMDYYLGQNADYPDLIQPYDRDPEDFKKKVRGHKLPSRLESALLGIGMAEPFGYDLRDAIDQSKAKGNVPSVKDAQLHVWRAQDSGVARHLENRATVERLRRVHPNVEMTVLRDATGAPMHHPFWHSVPNVAILASAMAEAAR